MSVSIVVAAIAALIATPVRLGISRHIAATPSPSIATAVLIFGNAVVRADGNRVVDNPGPCRPAQPLDNGDDPCRL